VNECQIFKVDLLDTFLDLEERVIEEVWMRVTEYPRYFICRRDVAFRGFVCARSYGFSIKILD